MLGMLEDFTLVEIDDCEYPDLVGHIDHIEEHADLQERESGLVVVRAKEEEEPPEPLNTGFYL